MQSLEKHNKDSKFLTSILVSKRSARRILLKSMLGFGVMLCSGFLSAAEEEIHLISSPVSVDEMAKYLFPEREEGDDRTNRKVVMDAVSTSSGGSTKESSILAILINFKFGKTEIVPESLQYLDTLAALLKRDEFVGESLIIEGHTDAVGGDNYNQELSEKRALAVRRYLVSRHNIEESRLNPVGKGERELYDQAKPNAAVNRRVQFKRLNQ